MTVFQKCKKKLKIISRNIANQILFLVQLLNKDIRSCFMCCQSSNFLLDMSQSPSSFVLRFVPDILCLNANYTKNTKQVYTYEPYLDRVSSTFISCIPTVMRLF